MSTAKRKYPKGFYEDGLGDILEWIDDEILVESVSKRHDGDGDGDDKKKKKKNKKRKGTDDGPEPSRRQLQLYGDNDLDELDRKQAAKKVKFLEEADDQEAQHQTAGEAKVVDKKLQDRARGLVNRLAAQTMPFVSSEFGKLYSNHSRQAINQALFNNIDSSVISKTALAKRKIVAELMLLVSYLNHKISHSIGASLVHHLVKSFDQLYRDPLSDNDKRLDNITFCLANLYIIGLISANIIFEFTQRICCPDNFRPKSTELLLIVLKNIGFQLRKDNPALMRQLIMMSHEQCKHLKQNNDLDTRIEFIMDALGAIKNNNMSKIGNYGCDIDKDTIESTLKNLIKRAKLPEALNDATYSDILNSANFHLLETRLEEEGDSSLAAATASGAQGLANSKQPSNKSHIGSKTGDKICKALGLNKPAEKTIFSALLKVTDYVEASNIIIGFGMNHCSDAMVVCLQVAIYEKKYNPFYFNLINNLCKFHRKYKMATKFAIQDKIRVLSGMTRERVNILKQLSFQLIQSDAVPITILKSVEWADLNESTKEYLTYLLKSISQLPEGERLKIMLKSDKRSSFAGAMRTFTNTFMEDCELFH